MGRAGLHWLPHDLLHNLLLGQLAPLSPALPAHTMERPSAPEPWQSWAAMSNGCILLPWGFIPFADGQDFLALYGLSPKTISAMMP